MSTPSALVLTSDPHVGQEVSAVVDARLAVRTIHSAATLASVLPSSEIRLLIVELGSDASPSSEATAIARVLRQSGRVVPVIIYLRHGPAHYNAAVLLAKEHVEFTAVLRRSAGDLALAIDSVTSHGSWRSVHGVLLRQLADEIPPPIADILFPVILLGCRGATLGQIANATGLTPHSVTRVVNHPGGPSARDLLAAIRALAVAWFEDVAEWPRQDVMRVTGWQSAEAFQKWKRGHLRSTMASEEERSVDWSLEQVRVMLRRWEETAPAWKWLRRRGGIAAQRSAVGAPRW